jgi:hypothetical protein
LPPCYPPLEFRSLVVFTTLSTSRSVRHHRIVTNCLAAHQHGVSSAAWAHACSHSLHLTNTKRLRCQGAITFDTSDTMPKVPTWARNPSGSGTKKRLWRSTGSTRTYRSGRFWAGRRPTMHRWHCLGAHEMRLMLIGSWFRFNVRAGMLAAWRAVRTFEDRPRGWSHIM